MVGASRCRFCSTPKCRRDFCSRMPLLVLAELGVHLRMRRLVVQFFNRDLIAAEDRPRVDGARLNRRCGCGTRIAAELVPDRADLRGRHPDARIPCGRREHVGVGIRVRRRAGRINLSMAGWWHALVSVPVFQFLLLRWYFRVFIWARFLWQMSRIDSQARADPPGPRRRIGLPHECRLRVHAGAARPRRAAVGPDRRSHLLRRRHAHAVQCGDLRRRWRAGVPGAVPADGVCGTAGARQAHRPRRVRRPGAALCQGVRREVAARRPRPPNR